MKIAVIIPSAGAGTRFQASQMAGGWTGGKGKIEVDLVGRPVLMRTVELFVNRSHVEQVLVAVDPDRVADFKFRWGDKLGFHGVKIVSGGKAERWQTVIRALEVVDDHCTHVAVHDAVRPLASDELIDRVFEAATRYRAVIPAVPVHGTLKRVSDCQSDQEIQDDPLDLILGAADKPVLSVKRVVKTVSRTDLVEVQTPQVFELGLLRLAYAQIANGTVDTERMTDDASLIEALGETVHVVDGEPVNLKITRAGDVDLAAAIITSREKSKAATLGSKRLFASDDEE